MQRLLFKIIGLSFLLLCCTALGLLKSNTLKSRIEALQSIKNGLLTLKERLRLHNGDKNRLLCGCFPNIDKLLLCLNDDDKKLWYEFTSHFGSSDTQSEYERCIAFIGLFENKITALSRNAPEQQRLYKSLGFFVGLFLCIFFM